MSQDLSALYVAPLNPAPVPPPSLAGVSVPLTGVRVVLNKVSGQDVEVDDRTFNPAWHEEIV